MVHIPVYVVDITDSIDHYDHTELRGVFTDFHAAKEYCRVVFDNEFPEVADKKTEILGGYWYDNLKEKKLDESLPLVIKRVMISELNLNEECSYSDDKEE